MRTGADSAVELWYGVEGSPGREEPAGGLVDELRQLALGTARSGDLAAVLYESLRKQLGNGRELEILRAVRDLAASGEPAGARLLAAMLDVVTPAARLTPLIRSMSSSRRLWQSRLAGDSQPGPMLQDWLDRLEALKNRCAEMSSSDIPDPQRPGWEHPWGLLRTVACGLMDRARKGAEPEAGETELLAGLMRLETDAWQERISHLAGTVDPFRVSAITRLLPLLSRADAEIRDLRHLTEMVCAGRLAEAFIQPQLRALTVLDAGELTRLQRNALGSPDLAPLGELLQLQQENPLPVHSLAYGAARLWRVSRLLHDEARALDLIGACRLVLGHHGAGEIALPVPAEVLPQFTDRLREARTQEAGPRVPEPGPDGWPLGGVEVLVGQLVVVLPDSGSDFPPWPHYLPTPQDHDPLLASIQPAFNKATRDSEAADQEGDGDENGELAASAMKNLVLTNIQSTSLVLGFLRNPKFVGIPGLVESVAVRTRNPRVIETIAADRTLHTGFANRGVALACLRSPVNVSVKVLRKFIHVKYVSKIDLKRLAQDRAGVRKEVIREIEKYLEALA